MLGYFRPLPCDFAVPVAWWQLPGPAEFAAAIADDIRDRKHVIISLPESAPRDLWKAIRLAGQGDPEWRTLHVDEIGPVDPLELLFARFVPDRPPQALWDVGMLITQEAFAGRVIWLDGLDATTWPAWKRFLAEYSHASRSCSVLDRTVLCVCLRGGLTLTPPPEDVLLVHHRWQGVVNELDTLLLASSLMHERGLPRLHLRLASATIARIALWDLGLAERLAHEDAPTIVEPREMLIEVAQSRGWTVQDLQSPTWHRGMSDLVDGVERTNSALLALLDPADELRRRLWQAQVGVMFPLVEEKRQQILDRLAHLLRVPFTTRFGDIISDVRELEIGHINNQITRERLPVDRGTRQLVRCLRDIRNSLSHLEPVPAELLLSTTLQEPG